MQSHKTLLANASHELRTPLARIRLAVELLKNSADDERRKGLEQDIAELDWLVDEILLASRLDAVAEPLAAEELDLLALAAEECARYDDVQLEGAVVSVSWRCAAVATTLAQFARERAPSRRPADPRENRARRRDGDRHRLGQRSWRIPGRNLRTFSGLSIDRQEPASRLEPDWAWRWYGKSHAAMAAKPTAKLWRADAAVLS